MTRADREMRRAALLQGAVLVLGFAITGGSAWLVRAERLEQAQTLFSGESDQITQKIGSHLDSFGLVLRAGAGVIASTDGMAREDWRHFVEQLQPQLTLQGVQGFGFARLLQPDELASHLAAVRAEGFPEYTITPAGERELYSPTVFLEPFDARNQRAFGYDMYSEPVRRSAMITARDTGRPSLSGKVTLLQESGNDVQAGTLMYFPVYATALSPESLVDRRNDIIGWTYSPFRMTDLVQDILQDSALQPGRELNLYIYDGTEPDDDALLYTSNPGITYDMNELHGQPTHHHRTIDFNDRSWLLIYDFSPAPSARLAALLGSTIGGGTIITLLLFGLLRSLQLTHQRAQSMTDQLTADIGARDAQLQESEFRWKYALEGAGDGVWDWNIANNEVYYSPRWKQMLGFEEQDIGSGLDEWKRRVHPDDLSQTMAAITACMSGRSTDYRSEHRVLDMDGNYKWILDRGSIVLRDRNGKPLRMIGTQADIDAGKQRELQLRQTLELLQGMYAALDQLDIYVFTKDTQLRYTYANQHTLALFGRSLDEVKGHGDAEFFPAETLQRLREIDQRVLAGDNTVEELAVKDANGKQRTYLEAKTPLRTGADADAVTGLCGITMDITSLKNLEASLQARQRELEEAQRMALMGSWTLDLASGEVTWSEQLYALFGLPGGSSPPNFRDHGKMFTEESWQRIKAAVDKAAHDGVPYDLEVEALEPSGARRWLQARGEVLRNDGEGIHVLRGIVQDITLRKQAEQRITHISSLYAVLSAFSRLVIDCKTADELYRKTCEIIVRHGGMDMAWIGLVEKAGTRVVPAHSAGSGTDYLDGLEFSIDPNDSYGRGATAQAIRENRPVWVEDFPHNPLASHRQDEARKFGWTSSAALPICRGGKPIGVLAFYSTTQRAYDHDVRILLAEISNVISAALDKLDAEALAYQGAAELEKVFMQTVGLATNLVELRDPYTAGHVRRVSVLSEAIGNELGLEPARVQGLRVAGFLYDIGKILIPAEILAKPGKLTAVELQLIRQHTRAGFNLLQHVDFPWPVAQVALHHHERLDGSGYPDGLKDGSIPLEARIVGLADVVLAMSSHRPWRAALPLEQALAEIEQNKGSLYDAAVVDACLRLFRDQHFTV